MPRFYEVSGFCVGCPDVVLGVLYICVRCGDFCLGVGICFRCPDFVFGVLIFVAKFRICFSCQMSMGALCSF